MFTTVTVKFQAESQQELATTLPSQFHLGKAHLNRMKDEGMFGPPEQVEMRYLLIGAAWRENPPEVVEVVSEEAQQHGVPDLED